MAFDTDRQPGGPSSSGYRGSHFAKPATPAPTGEPTSEPAGFPAGGGTGTPAGVGAHASVPSGGSAGQPAWSDQYDALYDESSFTARALDADVAVETEADRLQALDAAWGRHAAPTAAMPAATATTVMPPDLDGGSGDPGSGDPIDPDVTYVERTVRQPAVAQVALGQAPSARSASAGAARAARSSGSARGGSRPPRGPRAAQLPSPDSRAPRKKSGKGMLVVSILLLVIGVALVAGSVVACASSKAAYQVGIDEYKQVATANVTEDAVSGEPTVDFAALKSENSDIVGWIQVPGTPVNYPICQTGDNDYYLVHTFLDQYNLAGTIFMDYRSSADLSDWNTVIYGHHLQNGEMFAALADYSDQDTFDTLQNLYYVSEDGKVHVLVPLCCIVVNGYDVDSVQFEFSNQATFAQYVESLVERSSARSWTVSTASVNHIYMLATCSYAQDNDRTILVCVETDGTNGKVVDASASINDIQDAADAAAAGQGEVIL